MNVLSLFDGMSCGRIALERIGIKVDNYCASEIDKYAQIVSEKNYPDIIRLGDVRQVNIKNIPKTDILLGGSPCQSFSFAGKMNGMSTKENIDITTLKQYLKLKKDGFEFDGHSYLFWEYVRLLRKVKPKYFLLENVRMALKWQKIISEALGVEPILINSNLVSAQNRRRLYWTNIPNVKQPSDKKVFLKQILQEKVEEKYFLSEKQFIYISNNKRLQKKFTSINGKKALSLMAGYDRLQGTHVIDANGRYDSIEISKSGTLQSRYYKGMENFGTNSFILTSDRENCRKLTPIECERLQTIPDNYSSSVSDSQRYKMLGNGWTVDVIAHILKNIK